MKNRIRKGPVFCFLPPPAFVTFNGQPAPGVSAPAPGLLPETWTMGSMKTQEIRWFFGQAQAPLESLFQALPGDVVTREERTDHYLAPLLSDGLGIKVREGRLEIKSRTARPHPGQIAPGLEGCFETWVKYGFELRGSGLDPVGGRPAPEWLRVHKKRWGTLLEPLPGEVRFHPLGTDPGGWVQLEYTHFSLNGQMWYTFGLEWLAEAPFGIPEPFFADIFKGTRLLRERSLGYPAFLCQIKDGARG